MAVFPALNPASRSFTPGTYPNSGYDGLSGVSNRTRNSNVMLGSQLRLSFVAISEADMLAILAHYKGQRGSFESFPLPSIVWNGGGDASNYQLTGYGWIYNEPPSVVDYPCGNHDVELTLETVPPEGTTQLGLDLIITTTIEGSALAFNGVELIVGVLFEPGVTGPPGLAETITASLAAGAAAGGAGASGFNLGVAVTFGKGPDSIGFSLSVPVALTAGSAAAANGAALTATASIAGGTATITDQDAYFSSVSLLLHMNGSNNSTTFTDSSSNGLTVTANGNSKISTTQSKYGGAAGYFDGAGDYLSVAYNSALDLLGGDFTVECWLYVSAFQANFTRIMGAGGGAVAWNTTNGLHWIISIISGNKIKFETINGSGNITVTTSVAVSLTTWTHVAVCVSGSTAYVAIDGTVVSGSIGTVSRPSTNPTFNLATVPNEAAANNGFNGYMDELRITKGVARYTSNFTPPTAAFPNA